MMPIKSTSNEKIIGGENATALNAFFAQRGRRWGKMGLTEAKMGGNDNCRQRQERTIKRQREMWREAGERVRQDEKRET